MSSFAPGTPESVINEFNNRMYGTPINPMAGINPVTGLQTNQSLGLFSNVLGSLGNSGTPSYGQMPQGRPLMYRPGIDQYQTAPNSQEFSNVSNVLGQMPQGIAYQQLANGMPAYQQPVGNTPVSQQSFSANMGSVAPGTDTDAMYQNYLNAYNQNPNINPYTLQPRQPIGQSMTPEQSAFLDMQKQQMGIFPQMSQQSVQAPRMTAYDRLVQQRNQNLGNNFTPFGTVNRNNMPGFSRFPDYQQRGFGNVNAAGPINPAIVNPIRNR